jgi:zinc protease
MKNQHAIPLIGAVVLGLLSGPRDVAAQFPTTPPEPTAPRPVQLPPFAESTLPNGLRMVLVENHELPVVSITVSMPAGASREPVGKEGLAAIVSDVIVRGTPTRTAEQIAATIEGVGASLDAGAGGDFFTVSTTVLRDDVQLAFDLLGDVIVNATYPESEVELTRTRTLSSIRASEADPEFLADRFFAKALYGDHPYGRTTTSRSVESITRTDIVEFAKSYLRPNGALLVVAGDMSLDQLTPLASEAFAEWTGSAPALASVTVPPARPTRVLLVNRPGSVQSEIRLGNLTMRPGDPDYYAAAVADKILGTGFDSRLFLIVREEKGWTYDIRSTHARPLDVGEFLVRTPVRTEVTDSVLVEVLAQLRRMRNEPVTPEELAAAEGFLVGSFPLRIETPQQLAGQVRNEILLGLPQEYLKTYRDRIGSVTAAEVESVSRRIMKTDSAMIVVVGDGAAIYDKLTAFGPVSIVDTEGNPLTPDDLNAEIGPVAFDQEQIVSRRDSFAVLVQGNSFGGLTRDLEVDDQTIIGRTVLSLGPFLSQTTALVVDRGTMRAVKVDQTGQQQGQEMQVHIQYDADGRATGTVHVPGPDSLHEASVDTVLAPHVIDDNMVQMLAGAFPLAVGGSFMVATYDAAQGNVWPIAVRVTDAGTVTVPAGDFDAYKLDLTGGPVPLQYWVSKATPRLLLRMELVGQPISFELVQTEMK